MRDESSLLRSKLLPPGGALARDARGLAKLGDNVFDMVVNELIDPRFAARAGEMVQKGAETDAWQTQIIGDLINANLATVGQVDEFIRDTLHASGSVETTQDLFGESKEVKLHKKARAKVIDHVKKTIRTNGSPSCHADTNCPDHRNRLIRTLQS